MIRIESGSNFRIQRIRRILKGRDQSYFLMEGKKLVEEALQSGISLQEIFLTKDFCRKENRWTASLTRGPIPVVEISSSLMNSISELETPPGVLAVGPRFALRLSGGPRRFAAFLVSIRDPGNFGTILRSAEASGCEFIAYSHDCVDPFQSKVVRASMGSIFRVPLLQVTKGNEFLQKMRDEKVRIYGMVPGVSRLLFSFTPRLPALVMIGSESAGLPDSLPPDEALSIPMAGKVESLNAAMAATLCFYWFSKTFDHLNL